METAPPLALPALRATGRLLPSQRRALLVVVLTLVTGVTDAIGFTRLGGVFTSVMTGNMVLMGVAVGRADALLALHVGVAFCAYVIGGFAGAHIAGIAGVADFAGCDFIAALAQAMSSIPKVDDLPQRFLEIAGPSFPAAFDAWLAAGVFALDQPERFFEAVVAWSAPQEIELWRLHVTRVEDRLLVNMDHHPVRDDVDTVLVAGSRDDELDRHDVARRHERSLDAYIRRESILLPPAASDAGQLERYATSLITAQLTAVCLRCRAAAGPPTCRPSLGPSLASRLDPDRPM